MNLPPSISKSGLAANRSPVGRRPPAAPRCRAADSCAASRSSAFTLIEALLAVAVCAIVLVAINAVFATAVRLRDQTSAAVEGVVPLGQALETLRRDLREAVGPGGALAGDFKCGAQGMGLNMGLTAPAASGLDFFTATGRIRDTEPWGDLQEVCYFLQDPTNGQANAGKDLVRYVNRNLLATTLIQPPEPQRLLGGLQDAVFECYDGLEWRVWDTSMGDTNLPLAVRVKLQPAADPGSQVLPTPLEVIVPLTTVTRTNFTAAAGG
ncbi:MAG: prepilin-type N-terminal cleavage/methylation domain-containing protein [Verrucomicrobia bacterium]|nr:prepilin-type N-terminal cleavage/methylation domain-containing protein [Verrucomicrobiota bacterium]